MNAGKTIQLKRVVVTGMGALTPLGNSITEYWNNLRNGVCGCDFITAFDASKFKTRFACEIKNFDPVAYLDRKEARKLDRFSQLAITASDYHYRLPVFAEGGFILHTKVIIVKEVKWVI